MKPIGAHARPMAGGVETLIAISEANDPVPSRAVEINVPNALMWAGVASLLGSRKPVLWAGIGIIVDNVIKHKATPSAVSLTSTPKITR